MYLTYAEYEEMPFEQIPSEEFVRLAIIAGDVLDSITGDFYQFTDLETDYPYRQGKFKKAVAAQIGYMAETGATTSEGMDTPTTVSIGKTTITEGNRYSPGSGSEEKSLVCKDAVRYLSGTGLLNCGVGR